MSGCSMAMRWRGAPSRSAGICWVGRRSPAGARCSGVSWLARRSSSIFPPYWAGNASFGPRHALPALPLLCLPLAAFAKRFRKITLVLLAPSLALCLLAWATRPEAPPIYWDPLKDVWLYFFERDVIGGSILW